MLQIQKRGIALYLAALLLLIPCSGAGAAASKATTLYMIEISAEPAEGGTVTGGGKYEDNATAYLAATPKEGYTFLYWTEGGARVSDYALYSFTVSRERILVAHFAVDSTVGEEGPWESWTYPSVYTLAQTPKLVDGVAYVTLLAKDAQDILASIAKSSAQGRIGRLVVPGTFDGMKLRLSPSALSILKSAKIDALEIRSASIEIYLDRAKLEELQIATARENKTWQLLAQSGEGTVTLFADFYKGDAVEIGSEGTLLIRLAVEQNMQAARHTSWYDDARGFLVIKPKAFGTIALENVSIGIWKGHWAQDYLAYAVGKELIEAKDGGDGPYKDASGKTYTRFAFAEKLYQQIVSEKLDLRRARKAYPFADAASIAALTLQQMGIVAPLSDGRFGGDETITNGQAAAWLSRLEWLREDPQAAYGWTQIDGSQRMYYAYSGLMLTGNKSIDGVAYQFNEKGFQW